MKEHLYSKYNGLLMLLLMSVLLVPVCLLSTNVDLLSHVSDLTGITYNMLTNSAGSKGFLFTLIFLTAMTFILRIPKAQWASRMLQLALILIIGFASKTGLKHLTESPRPYTELLTAQLLIPDPGHFYKLDTAQKAAVIQEAQKEVSHWRTVNWQGEKDFSFPSGHTLFAAICVAFFGGLFFERKRYALAVGVLAWALAVAYSRLWLGMHRPADLFGSVLFITAVYALMPNFTQVGDKLVAKLPERWQHVLSR